MTALPNIVLVHGAWADGSSWSALGEVMGVPAWKSLPSWFLIGRRGGGGRNLTARLAERVYEAIAA